MFNIEADELIDMMVHRCYYCEYIEEGQCSKHNGCENGIRAYLKERIKDEVCDSEG